MWLVLKSPLLKASGLDPAHKRAFLSMYNNHQLTANFWRAGFKSLCISLFNQWVLEVGKLTGNHFPGILNSLSHPEAEAGPHPCPTGLEWKKKPNSKASPKRTAPSSLKNAISSFEKDFLQKISLWSLEPFSICFSFLPWVGSLSGCLYRGCILIFFF